MSKAPSYIVIAGPTASGKSALALALAQQMGGEIVGCDSVQLYRGFNIGSAKPNSDEMSRVPHHLINVVDWHEDYDAARYGKNARDAIDQIITRKKIPIVVGGTGLYLRALLQEAFHDDLPSDDSLRADLKLETSEELYKRLKSCDPKRAAEIHANDRFRVIRALELNVLLGGPVHEKLPKHDEATSSDAVIFIIDPERRVLHERIAARTKQMLREGLLEEVSSLLKSGVSAVCKPMESIGYKQAAAFLAGDLSEDLLAEHITVATRQYAKRQCTWFRKTKDAQVFPKDADPNEQLQIIQKTILSHR
jgi:tRNA dimethylallyltransferase